MPDLEAWGVGYFDAEYGGLPRGRSVLVTGRHGSGKSTAALQFAHAGLTRGQRVAIIADAPFTSYEAGASRLGLSLDAATRAGQCVFLDARTCPAIDGSTRIATGQARMLLDRHAPQRVVIDTLLPWVCPPDPRGDTALAETLDELCCGATALVTLPSPASTAARALRRSIERLVQTSVTITIEGRNATRWWEVSKVEGRSAGAVLRCLVQPGLGFVRDTTPAEQEARQDVAAISDARRASATESWRPLVDRSYRATTGLASAEGSPT